MKTVLVAIVTAAFSTPLAAQWLQHQTPGIPRTPDGKANLTAPAPRTPDGKPDLSGLWTKVSPKYARNIAADLKPEEIQPWARAVVDARREDLAKTACRSAASRLDRPMPRRAIPLVPR